MQKIANNFSLFTHRSHVFSSIIAYHRDNGAPYQFYFVTLRYVTKK